MRTIDVSKCWPFDGESKETPKEEVEASLPPIPTRKFRWWLDELERVKSTTIVKEREPLSEVENGFVSEKLPIEKPELDLGLQKAVLDEEKLVMVCPVCRIFSATMAITMNTHIDKCLAKVSKEERKQMRRANAEAKAKAKTQKKRSIVEIFAVAPQIETMEIDGDEEECSAEEDEFNLKRKKCKSKEKSMEIVRNLNWKKKKKNRNKGKIVDLLVPLDANKRKKQKLKVLSPLAFSGQLKGSLFTKRLETEISDSVVIRKRKLSSRKVLPVQNKLSTIQASKFIANHQQHGPSVFPVHSILKNQANRQCVQQSERRVRFSDKDNILEPTKKWCSSIKTHQGQSLWKELSDVTDASSIEDFSMEGDEHSPTTDLASEMNASDDEVAIISTDGVGARSTHKKKTLPDVREHVSVPTFDESVDLNQAMQNNDNFQFFSRGNSTALYNHLYGGPPRILNCNTKEGFNLDMETHEVANVLGGPNTSRSLLDPFVNYEHRSAALSSMANIKAAAQPSASCLNMNIEPNVSHTIWSQPAGQPSNVCATQYHPFGHMSPKDLMSSICSAVGWKTQRTPICGDSFIGENFIGLPLNSQGEFVQLHSSGRGGHTQLDKQNIRMGSSSRFPVHDDVWPKNNLDHLNMKEKHYVGRVCPKENLKLFPEKNCMFGITEMSARRIGVNLQDSLRGNSHSVQQLGSNMNLMNISYHDPQNQTVKGMIRSEESSECGFLPHSQPTVRLMGKDVSVGRSNKEVQGFEDGNIWTDKEIITEHRPTITVSDNSLNPHFQSNWIVHPMSQNSNEIGNHIIETQRNPMSTRILQMKDVEPRFAHSNIDWQTHLVSQNGIPMSSGNNSAKMSPFANALASEALQNRCQHMFSNSSQTSAFQFPFSSQDGGEYVKPLRFQNSSQNLPPWLLDATKQKEKSLALSQLHYDTSAEHYPFSVSGANFSAIPIPHHTPLISYPHNPNTSLNHFQSSSLPPLIPVPPGSKCITSINTRRRNRIKVKDKMKSKYIHLKNLDHVKKARKRFEAIKDDSRKVTRKPYLELRGDSNDVTGLGRREEFNVCTQYNTGSSEFDANRNKGVEIQKDGLRTTSGVNSSKVDYVARSGPIKLSAGAKHILKPSENLDQDNSRPTHSTIPFVAMNHAGEVSDFQKKSANIYWV